MKITVLLRPIMYGENVISDLSTDSNFVSGIYMEFDINENNLDGERILYLYFFPISPL